MTMLCFKYQIYSIIILTSVLLPLCCVTADWYQYTRTRSIIYFILVMLSLRTVQKVAWLATLLSITLLLITHHMFIIHSSRVIRVTLVLLLHPSFTHTTSHTYLTCKCIHHRLFNYDVTSFALLTFCTVFSHGAVVPIPIHAALFRHCTLWRCCPYPFTWTEKTKKTGQSKDEE